MRPGSEQQQRVTGDLYRLAHVAINALKGTGLSTEFTSEHLMDRSVQKALWR